MAILKTANFSGSNGSHFSIRLDYSLTQNKTANTSKIVYSLYFITDKYGSGYGSAVNGYINGVKVGSCTSIGTSSTILIGTKTEDVTHNSDGTKSVSYSASMSGPWTGLGSASLDGTLTLPKIDRLAILDENSLPTSITDESSIKFSYSNPSGFKVKPVITITQDSLISIEGDYITTSPCTWNWLTTDANKKLVYDCVRNSPDATARLKLNTYDSNNNLIGSTMSATTIPFKLVNCSPTIDITCTEQDTKVKNIVGSKLILLNNVSVLKVAASVATKKDATIVEVLVQGRKVESPYSTNLDIVGSPGNYTVNASVRDSRQIIVADTSSTYQLVDYQPVSINSYKFKRENPTSNKIKLNADITYWGITLNGTANAVTISYSTDGSSYITIPSSAYTIDNTNHKITIKDYEVADLDYQEQGTYYLKVVDKFTDDVENEPVTRGVPTTEKGKHDFQVNGDLYLADKDRKNKRPLNVSGDASKNIFNLKSVLPSNYGSGLPTAITKNLTINSFDKNSIDFTVNINAYMYALTEVMKLEPNTQYTISYERTNTNYSGSNSRFYVYNYNNGTYSINDSLLVDNGKGASKTFTTNAAGTVAFAWGFSNDASGASVKVSKIQLEKSSTATEHEEYYKPNIYAKDCNGHYHEIPYVTGNVSKNLFNSNVSGSLNGISYSVNGSEITLSGTASADTNIHLYDADMFSEYNGKNMSISANGLVNNVNIKCCNSGWGNTQTISNTANTKTFTINNNIRYLWVNILSGTSINTTINLQIELGSATEYEAYYEPTISIKDSEGNFHEIGFDNKDNYSEREQIIGTWIDGKPLYRKVFRTTFPTVSSNGTYVANKEVYFADNVNFSFLEALFIENGNQRQNLPYINNSGYVSKGFVQDNILMLTGNSTAHSGLRTTAIIKYTKSTD